MSGFAGRVALVTGAASGIGAATAALLRARGAAALGTDLRASADVFAHDVTDAAQWTAAIDECVARHGRLDVLVSNAGIASAGPIVELSLADLRAQIAVHVEGAWLGVRAAVAQMRAQADGGPADGSIVLVASIAGLKPIMRTTAYGVAKAAQIGLARAMGLELARAGDRIRVNAVCPGGTRTPMTETMFGDDYWADPANFASIPLKDYCRPDDIAEAIAHLAGDDAAHINAGHLVVDGGWVLSDRL